MVVAVGGRVGGGGVVTGIIVVVRVFYPVFLNLHKS